MVVAVERGVVPRRGFLFGIVVVNGELVVLDLYFLYPLLVLRPYNDHVFI